MGSSGSGQFGNYRPGGSGAGAGGSGGIGGGGKPENECPEIIEHIKIEDVGTSEYCMEVGGLPQVGAMVTVRKTLYKGRLVIQADDNSKVIGNLPTAYNSLLICLKRGMNYSGAIDSSGSSPIPYVVVTLHAES